MMMVGFPIALHFSIFNTNHFPPTLEAGILAISKTEYCLVKVRCASCRRTKKWLHSDLHPLLPSVYYSLWLHQISNLNVLPNSCYSHLPGHTQTLANCCQSLYSGLLSEAAMLGGKAIRRVLGTS